MFSQFFHPEKISPQQIENAALLALEIFAVVTGNFPAAFTVMAVHALMFAYKQAQPGSASEEKIDNAENNQRFMHA